MVAYYALPVAIITYCYGHIFYVIWRQKKTLAGHAARNRDVPMATTSRGQTTGQVQQQATGATSGANLSRTEVNVLKTMIAVVICFAIFWTPSSLVNAGNLLMVSLFQ